MKNSRINRHINRSILLLSAVFMAALIANAQKIDPKLTEDWSRKPEMVSLISKNIPSDAIVLFSKGNLDKWQYVKEDRESDWKVKRRKFTITPKSGVIKTVDSFGDCQLHIEWNTPKKDVKEGKTGQGCGNSGVFLMGLYEVQVLNSYENETYYNGQASSIYKQHIPLVNASKKPGDWQKYDIIFKAPVFDGEGENAKLIKPAYITVIHNGILVQNHVEIQGPTTYIGKPEYKWHASKLPLELQEHNNEVSYRNIWIRDLK